MRIFIIIAVSFICGMFVSKIEKHTYHLDLTDDSTYIYSNNGLVGVIPFDIHSKLDSVLMDDNQKRTYDSRP